MTDHGEFLQKKYRVGFEKLQFFGMVFFLVHPVLDQNNEYRTTSIIVMSDTIIYAL